MKMKIGTKLISGFMVLVGLILLVGIIAYLNLNNVVDEVDEMTKQELPLRFIATEANLLVVGAKEVLGDFLLSSDLDRLKKCEVEIDDKIEDFDKFINAMTYGSESEEFKRLDNGKWYKLWIDEGFDKKYIVPKAEEAEQVIINEAQKHHDAFLEIAKKLMDTHRQMVSGQKINISAAEAAKFKLIDEMDEISGKVIESMDQLEDLLDRHVRRAENNIDKAASQANFMIVVVSVISLIFGVSIGVFLSRSISRPIVAMAKAAEAISAGDLTHKIKVQSKDEIGDMANSLRKMIDNLRNMVGNIYESSDQVAASSEELTKTAQSLSEGSQKQASSLEESSASMEEMTKSVEQISEKAQSQASSVEEVTSTIEELTSSIQGVYENAKKVRDGANNSLEQADSAEKGSAEAIEGMKRIQDSSDKIKDIVGVINDIADQTNLLALNASVEAARAGDAGRGFAVVAQEISKLADRSAGATKDIADLIKETGVNVESGSKMVTELDESIKKMKEISQTAAQFGGEMANATEEQINGSKQVSEAIQNVNELSQAIASAAEEQASTTQETSKTIEGVNEITQQAASSAEEMSSSTEELSTQAENLKSIVGQFKISESKEGEVRVEA